MVCVFKHLYCSAQLSMSKMEKRYRNKIIIIIKAVKVENTLVFVPNGSAAAYLHNRNKRMGTLL